MTQDWSNTQKEVWELEERYWDLAEVGDVKGYISFWQEGSVAWPPDLDRPESIDVIRVKEEEQEGGGSFSYSLEPFAVQVFGVVALTYCKVSILGQDINGKEITKNARAMRATHTWMKRDGEWRIIGGMGAFIEG